jgi:tRNA nucleotidyltransferase/poly(A) polymerase
VIDYVGGQEDLRRRVLRAIGEPDQRFAEDHLRLLRAVRFAARFDLAVEAQTAEALRRHALQLIRNSPERSADELRHVLTAPTRARAWPMLWEYALAQPIFRFLTPSGESTFDAGRSLFLAIAPGEPIPFGLALAGACLCYQLMVMTPPDVRTVLQRDSAHWMARAMRKALKISNDELEQMAGVLEQLRLMLADAEPTVALKKRLMASAVATPTRQLLRAMGARGHFAPRCAGLERDFIALAQVDCAPVPLLDGEDLIAAGLKPGPAFKAILSEIYDAQLEAIVQTKEAALALALRRAAVINSSASTA